MTFLEGMKIFPHCQVVETTDPKKLEFIWGFPDRGERKTGALGSAGEEMGLPRRDLTVLAIHQTTIQKRWEPRP